MRHPRLRRTEPAPGPDAPRRVRRGTTAAIGFLVAALALVATAAVGTLAAGSASAAGSCSGPLDAGQIRVVLVVDPGESGPRAPSATCLVVAAGTPGSKILAQRAAELGLPSPRYADSGLLCGLDGFPGTGCPVNSGGTYAYWAYFNGVGGAWSYGRDNPFVRRMVDGEIMGWRYSAGASEGDAPTPRIAPGSSLFPALASPPTATPPAGGGGAPGASGGGSQAGGVPALPDLSGLATTTTRPGDPVSADPTTTVAGDGSTSTADADDGAGAGATGSEELAAEPARSTGSSPSRWIGPAAAVAAAGALAVGAVTRNRRRARVGG